MLRDLCQVKRLFVLVPSVLALLVAGSGVQAQITLRPSQDQAATGNPTQGSSRRPRPVSRGVSPAAPLSGSALQGSASRSLTPPVLSRSEFREPVRTVSVDREYEFQQLQEEADALERQLGLVRRIVKFASPSIVHIEATKKADPGKGFASSRIEEAGAGVIVNLRGIPHVLTNRHVIYPADISSIRIELNDGRQLRATNIWTDPSTDVAVMRLSQRSELVAARLGNSDHMEIGDFVLAVGSPFGLSHSVTYGILSAKGRRNLELGSKEIEIQDFFQTDAAINPGNSGGPLLNLRGQVVAINTAIASNSGGNEGIGFSIPINLAVLVAEQLISRGKLLRSYLGVQLENAFDVATANRLGLSSAEGALVKSIIPNSPAYRAGIRVGDVIVEFNGVKIENDGHLVKTVGLTPVGQQVSMLIYRDGSPSRLSTVLDSSPDQ